MAEPMPGNTEQAAPAAPASTPVVAPVRKSGHGCFFKGCLTSLLVIVLVVAGVGALLARLPAALGIWPSGATLLEGTPDRAGAAAIIDELKAAGIDTTGLTLYVMPVKGQSGTLAYAVLDTSAGFKFPKATISGRNPIPDIFTRLTGGPAAAQAGVAQVAIEYRDPTGSTMGVLTASNASIHDFAAGLIDQTTFANAMHGSFNPAGALNSLSSGGTP